MRKVLLVVAALSAGCFVLDRHDPLVPGSIQGRAVRRDLADEPAKFSLVSSPNAGTVRRASQDGTFVVRGLAEGAWALRFVDDADGDGIFERQAVRAVRIAVVADGAGQRLSGIDVGDVRLDGTYALSGGVVATGVPDVAAGPPPATVVAKVYALRSVDVEDFRAAAETGSVILGVEAEASVDDEGRFLFPALGTGDVQIVGAIYERGDDGVQGELIGLSAPVAASSTAGEDVDLGDGAVDVAYDDALVGATRDVQLAIAPAPESATIRFVTQDRVDVIDEQQREAGTGLVSVAAPIGVSVVEVEDEEGRFGVLQAQLLLPEALDPATGPPTWGPVLLHDELPCGADGDCDGDGVPGLPLFDPDLAADDEEQALWVACGAQCAGAFGEEGGDAVCEVDGERFDCEDDGDGQADVTERIACYGVGLGTDRDQDGLCEPGQDPFPHCAENDPAAAACSADAAADPEPRPEPVDPGAPPPVGDDGGVVVGEDGGSPTTSCRAGTHDDGSGDCVYVSSVGAGHLHTCVVKVNETDVDAQLLCFGANGALQIGQPGTTTSSSTPTAVPLAFVPRQVVAGDQHTCVLVDTGDAYCFGGASAGQLGPADAGAATQTPQPVDLATATTLAIGDRTTCAVQGDDTVVCWGSDAANQIGDGNATPEAAVPTPRIVSLPPPVQPFDLALGGGDGTQDNGHACVVYDDGRVYCWGANGSGQLGAGFAGTTQATPLRALDSVDGGVIVAEGVAAGRFHTCAFYTDDSVRCWGGSTNGQLGLGPTGTADAPIEGVVDVGGESPRAIAAGALHTCAVTGDFALRCWGDNQYGQLGIGPGCGVTYFAPQVVPGIVASDELALGMQHTCVVDLDGALFCWGDNSQGQLGVAGVGAFTLPVSVDAVNCASGYRWDDGLRRCEPA